MRDLKWFLLALKTYCVRLGHLAMAQIALVLLSASVRLMSASKWVGSYAKRHHDMAEQKEVSNER